MQHLPVHIDLLLILIIAWLPGRQAANLPLASAQFWARQNLTWSVLARVDGETCSLFGVPSLLSDTRPASMINARYTTTHKYLHSQPDQQFSGLIFTNLATKLPLSIAAFQLPDNIYLKHSKF